MTVTVQQAAKHFGVHVTTIHGWVRHGCPCVAEGSVGRGRGSLLDLEAVESWRVGQLVPTASARAADDVLAIVATALWDVLMRDGLAGMTLPAERMALTIYERLFRNLKQQPLEWSAVPDQLKCQFSIYLQSAERGTFHRR